MKRYLSLILTLTMLLSLAGCGAAATSDGAASDDTPTVSVRKGVIGDRYKDAYTLTLSPEGNYSTGVPLGKEDPFVVDNKIVYYEAGHDFTYGEGTADEAHTPEEAAEHTVFHLTKPGTYVISGTLERGQIAVDLGEDAKDDPDAVVTLVLNGVDITCTVAPAVIFYHVYECGSDDADTATYEVDTSEAGANVVLVDGSVNRVEGSHVARIYKSVVLNDAGTEVIDSKKLHKYDAAFYSKMSMNIDGEEDDSGVLHIIADNEGLDSELHLTINGGNININSGNDGINTNEDGVSVTTINGGTLDIVVNGTTGEGDGIDSNGWLVINDGTVFAQACATSGDAGIDSDMGIYLNGGVVVASGNMLDAIAGGSATYAVFEFAQQVDGGESVVLKDADGATLMLVTQDNPFRYLVLSVNTMAAGDYSLWVDDVQMAHSSTMGSRMPRDFDPTQMQRPEGMEQGDPPAMPEGRQMMPPEGMENMTPPDGMDGRTPPEGGFEFRGEEDKGGFGGQMPAGDQSKIFTITTGGNYFSGVEPALR